MKAFMAMSTARTVSDQVFERLRDDLRSNRFAPGERLKFQEMRNRYQVGFGPLREALSRLAGLGLVSLVGQKGFRAAALSPEDLLHLVENRRFLEERALRASIEKGDERWESNLFAAFHQLHKVTQRAPEIEEQYLTWERHHAAFHYALVSGCGSEWLLNAWRSTFDQAERYRRVSIGHGRWVIDQKDDHERLLKASSARNAEKAIEILNRHIGQSALSLSKRLALG
jgi:GntR family carbon starvation induced transcriptional regulator